MALYDDASFIFLASGAARTDTKDFSKIQCVKPVEAVSSTDLVINGDFSIDGPGTDGALGTAFGSYGWNTVATDESGNVQEGTTTIKNGVLKLTNASGDVDCRAYITNGSDSRNVLTTNSYYKLVYTIVENDSCTDFRIYNGAGAAESAPSSVGTHTRVVRNTSNQLFLFFNKTESSSISIDNVSLKEFTTRNADFDISRDANLDATRVGPTGLIEKGRENLAHYSNNFATTIGGGGWGHSGINTISTGQDGYDGTTNATAVFASTSTAKHQVTLGTSQSLPGTDFSLSGVFTLSVHAKPNGYDHLIIRSDRTNVDASFNIATGVLGTKGSECIESSMTAVGNGFYRCQATFAPGAATTFLSIGMMEQDDTTDFTGNTSKGYILQDAQLEVGLVATDLIPTSGAAGTAGLKEDEPRFDYPVAGGPPSLLLEPQATNIVTHSEGITLAVKQDTGVVASAPTEVSPSGHIGAVVQASNLLGATGDRARVGLSSITDGDTVSGYFYIKGDSGKTINVTLKRNSAGLFRGSTITHTCDGEWQKVGPIENVTLDGGNDEVGMFLVSASDGSSTLDSCLLWGYQIEKTSFSTSYIPTHGATATRSLDNVAALDTSGFSFGTTCTIFFEGIINEASASFIRPITMFNSHASPTTAERFLLFAGSFSSGTYTLTSRHNTGGATVNISRSGLTVGAKIKCVSVFNGTSSKFFVNGVSGGSGFSPSSGTNTITAASIFNSLDLLQATTDSNHAVGSVILWDSALTDQQCIDLTTL